MPFESRLPRRKAHISTVTSSTPTFPSGTRPTGGDPSVQLSMTAIGAGNKLSVRNSGKADLNLHGLEGRPRLVPAAVNNKHNYSHSHPSSHSHNVDNQVNPVPPNVGANVNHQPGLTNSSANATPSPIVTAVAAETSAKFEFYAGVLPGHHPQEAKDARVRSKFGSKSFQPSLSPIDSDSPRNKTFDIPAPEPKSSSKKPVVSKSKMIKPKKRRSLQAILIQPFIHSSGPSSPTGEAGSSPTSPTSNFFVPPLSAPAYGVLAPPPPLSVLTGSGGRGRARTMSQSSISGMKAAVSALVRASRGGEDASTLPQLDTDASNDASGISSPSFSSGAGVGGDASASNLVSGASIIPLAPVAVLAASSSTAVTLPSRCSPPPSFLIDDDPFANLSPVTVGATAGRASTSTAPSSPIVPHSERPKPIHPELMSLLAMPSVPLTPLPQSSLHQPEENIEVEKAKRAGSKEREKEKGKEGKRKRAKTFFGAMSAPVSPSKGFFFSSSRNSGEPAPAVPPMPSTSTNTPNLRLRTMSTSVPSSPKLPPSPRPPLPPSPNRAFSSPRLQTRPAHQRPAFIPRPSLPSLDSLAKMNIVLNKKVRKGHVGAGLPFEPWDLPSDEDVDFPHRIPVSPSTAGGPSTPALTPTPVDSLPSPDGEEGSSVAPFLDTITPGTVVEPGRRSTTPTPPVPSRALSVSPTSTSSSHPSSASSIPFATPPTQPQPLLPSQILAFGALAQDLEMMVDGRRSSSRSPPPPPVPAKTPLLPKEDQALPPLPPPSPSLSIKTAAVAPALPPVQLFDDLDVPLLNSPRTQLPDVGAVIDANSDATSQRKPSEEAYFGGNVLDGYDGIARTSEDHGSTRHRSEDDTSGGNLSEDEPRSRWSMETDESVQGDFQPHSPTQSYSNSYAGSYSDLASVPAYPPSYDYGYWNSQSDMDSTTDVSQDLTLSRSISSTSHSSCSFDDEMESKGHNYATIRGRALNASDSSQSTDAEHSRSRHRPLIFTKPLPQSSGNNSLLHSPDSEWSFFAQQQACSPHREYYDSGSALGMEAAVLDSGLPVSGHQPQAWAEGVFLQAETPTEDRPIATVQGCDRDCAVGNLRTSHAAPTHALAEAIPSTADNSLTASVSTVIPPFWTTTPQQELHYTVDSNSPVVPPASDDSHQSSSSTSGQSSADGFTLSHAIPLSPLLPPSASVFEPQDQDSPSEMAMANGLNARPREKMSLSGGSDGSSGRYRGFGTSSASSRATSGAYGHNDRSYVPASPHGSSFNMGGDHRGSDYRSDEAERRRKKLLAQAQLGRDHGRASGVASGDEEAARRRDMSASGSRSASRSVSRGPTTLSPPANRQRFPTSSFVSSLSTSDEDESESSSSSDDDDVPLAQRIPGALTAQKTIRRQVKEEREAKRAERARKQRERQTTLRPAGAALGAGPVGVDMSSSHEAALSAVAAISSHASASGTREPSPAPRSHSAPRQRQRTMTMPSKPSAPLPMPEFGLAFNPEDLAKKLQSVKIMGENSGFVASPTSAAFPAAQHQSHLGRSRTTQHTRTGSSARASHDYQPLPLSQNFTTPPPTSAPGLRTMRSFHKPATAEHHGREAARVQSQGGSPIQKRSISIGRNDRRTMEHEEPLPPLPSLLNSRISGDEHGDRDRRVLMKAHPEPRMTASRTSVDIERGRPSVANSSFNASSEAGPTSKERIFIHSLQHYHMVDVGASTSAGDLIAACEAEGVLDGWAGLGEWMLWEIAQDFGMERPVRHYELLHDVESSWLKEKTVNFFLLKKTPLAVPLARSAIPSSAPTHSGYVEWEAKRGKWNKRWLRLKENALYLSKRDNGRDETLICSLSNFDAYFITRSHRAPKPFAFTIKSTDNISFFENTADYMHTFSCSEKDGQAWMEKILIARSYVLHQERHVLFSPKNSVNSASAALSRSDTRKPPSTRPTQPLLDLSLGGIFEPGSLLSKQQ